MFLCPSLGYITKNWGTALAELCLLGNKDTNAIWVKWLWEKPIAALIVINRITKLVYKISLSKILSPHWLHKNIQPSKGEGTKRPNKGNEDKARGGGGKNFRRPFTLK